MKTLKTIDIRASKQLLSQLQFIGARLMSPTASPQSEDTTKLLQELGRVVFLIGQGESAHKLFRQNEKTKPQVDRFGVALTYWFIRACGDNPADDRLAISKAASAHTIARRTNSKKPLAKTYVRKISQEYRSISFKYLENQTDSIKNRLILYMFDSKQIFLLLNDKTTRSNLNNEEAQRLKELEDELSCYNLTQEKISQLQAYLDKKSGRLARWNRALPS